MTRQRISYAKPTFYISIDTKTGLVTRYWRVMSTPGVWRLVKEEACIPDWENRPYVNRDALELFRANGHEKKS